MKLANLVVMTLFVTVFLNACSSSAKLVDNIPDAAVPQGIKEPVTILLVTGTSPSYTASLSRNFGKNYQGSYKVIRRKDLESGEYNDVKKYRYVFDHTERYVAASGAGSMRTSAHYVYSFFLTDRTNNYNYRFSYDPELYDKWMSAYAIKLEQARSGVK